MKLWLESILVEYNGSISIDNNINKSNTLNLAYNGRRLYQYKKDDF